MRTAMRKHILLACMVAGSVFATSCSQQDNQPAAENPGIDSAAVQLAEQGNSIFGILPASMPGSENDTKDLQELGRKLYFETRLSVNNTQSCNSCHNIEGTMAGVDNLPTSPGALGKNGTRNSPTVLNAGFHTAQFWDGRAADLAEQAKGPVLNPVEMAIASEKDVVKMLKSDAEYPGMFAKAFPADKDPMTFDNVANAIAAFERTLVTPSRFDDFLAGDHAALTAQERKGMQTFVETGCITCHIGPLVGGSMFQKMGLVKPYANTVDKGKYDITKEESDMYVFKVPSLRNAALTAPYFHDGAVTSLEEAIKVMADIQLGRQLTDEQTKDIAAFIGALSDKKREKSATAVASK